MTPEQMNALSQMRAESPFFPLYSLSNAWNLRSAELAAEKLQIENDLLFSLISMELEPKMNALHEHLATLCSTASNKSHLNVPIWSYNSCYWFKNPAEATYEEKEEIRLSGQEWTMNLWSRYEYDDGSIYDTLQSTKRIDEVIKKTDLLVRLAAKFGPNFSCSVVKDLMNPEDENESYSPQRCRIILNYYPNGPNEDFLKKLADCYTKYKARTNITPILTPPLRYNENMYFSSENAYLIVWKGANN